MVLKILITAAVFVVAILIFAATRPNTFRVERTVTIHASPEKIFAMINDLRAWESWAPDDRKDPTMKTSYSGSARGLGAASAWDSKGRGGVGHMQILESAPSSRVAVMVDFVRPFEAHNLNEFKLEPDTAGTQAPGPATRVTWRIQASNLYAMKLVGVFFNIPREFGKHIDTGLNNMKVLAEKQANAAVSPAQQ
jgi:uncharacterized protein YndB with AHSA1/START domain